MYCKVLAVVLKHPVFTSYDFMVKYKQKNCTTMLLANWEICFDCNGEILLNSNNNSTSKINIPALILPF
jgi:hypothetical protein